MTKGAVHVDPYICLERGADLHMAQLMPLPLTVSCFSKIKMVLPFWYRPSRVVPDKGPLNGCMLATIRCSGSVCSCASAVLAMWATVDCSCLSVSLSRAGFKRRGELGSCPAASTTKGLPQKSKNYYQRKHKNTF